MRIRRTFRGFALLLSFALLICALPAAGAESDKTLTILFTTDIHSNVLPYRTLVDGEVATVGGFARLKTAVEQNRVEGRTLLVDSGDFAIGTMFQNFFQTDPVELRLMDALGYDAVAIGNHDFDYGEQGLRNCLAAYRASGGTIPFLCSNLIDAGGAFSGDRTTNPLADYGVANYQVTEVNGVRVGLFSLMGKDATGYIVNEDYAFSDQAETAKACVRLLRETEQCDLVVLLSHCGTMPGTAFVEDEELAAAVDGIDVIFSGHSHVQIPEPIVINDTVIVGAGTALACLGKLELTRENGKWSVLQHELIPLDASVPADADFTGLIAPYEARLNEEYLGYYGVGEAMDEYVALSPDTFPTGDSMCLSVQPYPFAQLIMDAYDYALTALCHEDYDVGALAVGGVRQALYKGNVSVAEIYNVLGYGDSPSDGKSGSPVILTYVTGRELYDVAETSASLSSIVSAAQLFFANMRYTVDEGRPLLNRVRLVEVYDRETGAYKPVARDDTLYRFACSYSAANLISLVKDNSFGLFSVALRDENGTPVSGDALLSRVARYTLPSGETRELKEWYALYAYLRQMEQNADGLSVIPESYVTEDARFIVRTDDGLPAFFENPSKPGRILFAVGGALLLIVLTLCIALPLTRKKRAAKRAARRAARAEKRAGKRA